MSCGVGPLDCVADAMAVVGSDDGVVVDSVVRPVYCVHHPLDAPRAGGGCARTEMISVAKITPLSWPRPRCVRCAGAPCPDTKCML